MTSFSIFVALAEFSRLFSHVSHLNLEVLHIYSLIIHCAISIDLFPLYFQTSFVLHYSLPPLFPSRPNLQYINHLLPFTLSSACHSYSLPPLLPDYLLPLSLSNPSNSPSFSPTYLPTYPPILSPMSRRGSGLSAISFPKRSTWRRKQM